MFNFTELPTKNKAFTVCSLTCGYSIEATDGVLQEFQTTDSRFFLEGGFRRTMHAFDTIYD